MRALVDAFFAPSYEDAYVGKTLFSFSPPFDRRSLTEDDVARALTDGEPLVAFELVYNDDLHVLQRGDAWCIDDLEDLHTLAARRLVTMTDQTIAVPPNASERALRPAPTWPATGWGDVELPDT